MVVPVLGREYFSTPQTAEFKALRSLMFCGEPLPPELVNIVYNNTPMSLASHNAYGALGMLDGRACWRLRSLSNVLAPC
jgi:acyl-coenzyme A synthetase/AMP-(fatty) acid ligase